MADPALDEERSPAARARAERALCTLAAHIADDDFPLVVLGGLMPEILTEGREAGPRELTADLPRLGLRTVRVRFAGLAGYLLTKCVSVHYRGKDKDHYDLAFVLLHNRAGGPTAAARLLLDGKLADRLPALRTTFLEVRERFHSVTQPGPKGFAAESARADPSASEGENRAGCGGRRRVHRSVAGNEIGHEVSKLNGRNLGRIRGMKISVSLASEDVAFLDSYAGAHELPSRSAAVQTAIRTLRLGDLSEAYRDAWGEWESSGEASAWDAVAGDGV